MRKSLAGFGLAIGLVALSGCVPPTAAPQVALIAEPVAITPPPVVLTPPPVPVAVLHHAPAAHRASHRRVVHRYASVQTVYAPAWSPGCGAVAHPCTVHHTTVPIE